MTVSFLNQYRVVIQFVTMSASFGLARSGLSDYAEIKPGMELNGRCNLHCIGYNLLPDPGPSCSKHR